MTTRAIRILGIDPGLRRTGWGVIDVDGNRLIYVGCGSVESRDSLPLSERLLAIHEGLLKVMSEHGPMEAAVEQSDNSAADYLMKKIGGPTVVTRFLRQHGIDHIRVDRYEHEIQPASVGLPKFHGQWIGSEALDEAKAKIPLAQQKKGFATYLADARDKLTARGGAEFMRKLTAGKLLNKDSSNVLLAILKAAVTGKGRIHAGLPSNAILAHKTGTGATVDGVCCASNDVGIVFLPDGTQFEIAVLLSGSALTPADQDKIMAAAAKIAVSHIVQPSRSN